MGEPLKAEAIVKHFACIVSPSIAATPFGSRQVFGTAAVTFAVTLMPAFQTYGNSAPLFLKRSTAVMPTGMTFKPSECLQNNPVEQSYATSHGHMGTIKFPNGGTVPGAINCGVLPGPNADCSAELEGLLEAIAERMAAEFMQDPLKFMSQFKSASDATMLAALGDTAKGWWDTISGAAVAVGGAIKDGAVASYDYVSTHSVSEIASDAAGGAKAVYRGAVELTADTMAFIENGIDALKQLSLEDLKDIFKEWLREVFGELACSLRDALAQMANDPRPMATQLGEVDGMAKAFIAETAGAILVDAFVTKGAMSAASKIGRVAGKVGPKIGGLVDKIKARVAMRRAGRAPEHPSRTPNQPQVNRPAQTPEVEKHKNDALQGTASGQGNANCLLCPTKGEPVNTIYGCKILSGDEELDFVIDAPLPLVWQRNYASNNAHDGMLGQGWCLPLDFRIEIETDALTFIETQGRRIRFPMLAVGAEFLSLYEHTVLRRTERNRCELLTPDGVRLIFGLSPRDWANLAERDAQEQRQAEQFDRALATLREAEALQAHEADADRFRPGTDLRPPQAGGLVLLGVIDPNDNWLRLHYAADDRPQVIETSNGRYVGLHFDPQRDAALTPRLLSVSELLGKPDAQGRFAAARTLVEYRYSNEGDLLAVVDDNGETVRTFAWSNHLLVEHAVPGGLVSRYEWDQLTPRGRVITNRLSTGELLRFSYDPIGRENSVADASGRVTLYRYDDKHYYTGLVTPDGAETRFIRDNYGALLAATDPLGRVTRYNYDPQGNLTRVVQPDGSTYALRHDAVLRKPVAVTDPLGQTTEYRYDSRGNLVEVRDAAGATTRYTLDQRGRVVSLLDARGGQSFLSYDSAGRLTEYRDCLGQPTLYTYDDQGNVTAIADALGATTHFTYQRINRRDRLIGITQADGNTERMAYDSLGRLIAHVDAVGQATRYMLAPDGQPLARENPLGHALRYQYDVHGRLLALTNENGAVYHFAWDATDRLIGERGFDGRRIDYRYNAAGELVESADGVPQGAEWLAPGIPGILRTRYQRDALGRLTDKLSAKSNGPWPQISHNRFTYNLNGQLVRSRNAQARVELHYTATGLLAREITRARAGSSSTIEHVYDGLGNRYESVLPDGRVLRHHLYGSGHVDRITLDDRLVCRFERDALQRETVRHQGALRTFYERDVLGRLTRQVARKADPSAPAAEPRIQRFYHYDRSGQLVRIEDARHGASLYRYDATGRLLAAMTRAGGDERFAFDPANNLLDTQASANVAAHGPTADRRAWSDAEWQAFLRENVGRDGFNPLLGPEQLTTDPAYWGEAKPNRLTVYQEHRYRYDVWGNCTEKRSGAHELRAFLWNAEHQLASATVARMERGRFVHERWGYDYDPFGRRVAKYRLPDAAANEPPRLAAKRARQATNATHFTWDGNRLLLERTAGNQTLYLYEPESFVPLALVRSAAPTAKPDQASPLPQEWLSLKDRYPEQWAVIEQRRQRLLRKLGVGVDLPTPLPVAEVFYVHADHLGTPRELTDDDGHVVWSASYKAWGAASIDTPPRRVLVLDGNALRETWEPQAEPVVQNVRFQGQYFDAETGLHYNRFRYYDPDAARFVTQDPIRLLGGANSYEYGPSAIAWIDPLGLAGRFGVKKSGHHAPAVRKSVGRPFEMSRSNKCWPTLFPKGADPEHEHGILHEAERKTVGKRQGPFTGTDKDLFQAYEKAYDDPSVAGIKVDLKSPDGSVVLCQDCTPLDAIKKMQEWLKEKGMLC